MAISHNLSDVTNGLSGFDPVSAESDGTTIGRSWLLWKVFEGLSAFNTNLVKITNASPTPNFLQGQVGVNLQTEPAKNRANTADIIRFYDTSDVGLTEATPRAFIYELQVSNTTTGYNLASFRIQHLISGGTLYTPFTAGTIFGAINTVTDCLMRPAYNASGSGVWATTTTTMNQIPSWIFWQSSNAWGAIPIFKGDATYAGGLIITKPDIAFEGYKHNVGAITNDRVNASFSAYWNQKGGVGSIEPISQVFGELSAGIPTDTAVVSSTVITPSAQFTFSGKSNVIGGYMRFAMKKDSSFLIITDTIEGILLGHPTAVAGANGSILKYNTKYYLLLNQLNNVWSSSPTQRVLLELGT